MSTVLLLGGLYGALIATLLWWTNHNVRANRFLSALLIVIALQLLPYIIGYAGFYDAFPWLSYAPYEASLAIGPLLYWYVRSLTGGAVSTKPWWHFVPVAIQLAYYCAIFPMPLAFKDHWNEHIHVPYIVPLEQLATFCSMATYWLYSLRIYRGYQAWLSNSVSDREDHHIEWVRNFLIVLGLTLLLWISLVAFERIIAKLNYFEQFPFYVWLAVLTYYLGTEGYRNSSHRFPRWEPEDPPNVAALTDEPPERDASDPGIATVPANREAPNWMVRSELWRKQLIENGWWRDADLSLNSLARKLGTNTSDLSRAINEGMGLSFNELINRLRVEEVQRVLSSGDNQRGLLDIAFDAGFSSKASFNRSFKLYAGLSPSEFRKQLNRPGA